MIAPQSQGATHSLQQLPHLSNSMPPNIMSKMQMSPQEASPLNPALSRLLALKILQQNDGMFNTLRTLAQLLHPNNNEYHHHPSSNGIHIPTPQIASRAVINFNYKDIKIPTSTNATFCSRMEGLKSDKIEMAKPKLLEAHILETHGKRNEDYNLAALKSELDTPAQLVDKGKCSKKIKKTNICPHTNKEHYAKNLCYNCYHRYGRNKKPWKCDHERLYARGLCQNCYINQYNRKRKRGGNRNRKIVKKKGKGFSKEVVFYMDQEEEEEEEIAKTENNNKSEVTRSELSTAELPADEEIVIPEKESKVAIVSEITPSQTLSDPLN